MNVASLDRARAAKGELPWDKSSAAQVSGRNAEELWLKALLRIRPIWRSRCAGREAQRWKRIENVDEDQKPLQT